MTEAGQAGLTEFSSSPESDGEKRPDEEAVAVAGATNGSGVEVVDVVEETLPDADGDLELAVMQVDYTVTGYGDEEQPIIHVFGRTPDGTLEHVQVVDFEPYFYAPTETLERPPEEEYDRLTGSREYDRNGERYESIRGEKLTKIFGQTPRDVGQVRDDFEHYEADILFPNRFLIDKDVRSGIRIPERRADDDSLVIHHEEVEPVDVDAEPRVLTFDIEVDDRSGFPEDGEEPIVCLTSHDSYEDEYIMWLYEAPIGDGEIPAEIAEYDPIEGEIDHEVRAFEEEEAMLEAFMEYVEETDGDVLTGWNFEDFDAPYFLDRLEELQGGHDYDLSIDRLSRVDEVWRSNWGGPDIKGRVVFDLLYGYQRMVFSELDSYRLDAVGEEELGVGKERYAGDIGDLWEDNPTQLLEYNLRDVELCVELDRQQAIVAFWDEVRSFVGCKLEDAPTPGDAVDMYVLHQAHGRFALPSKGQQEAGEEYEGGAVFEPITGVKENVTVLDLKSLYPMCMVTVNASPETKVDPETYDGETYEAPTGTHFRKEPDGVNRTMIEELLAEREEKKELRNQHEPGTPEYEQYDRQQGAVKVIMNSLYGVSGWEQFRLYDKEAAAAITATGREVIEFTETAANELDYQVAYGDTDSVMLELGDGIPKEKALETSFEIEEHINDRYDDFAREDLNADQHRFQIEFEKLYRRFFQAGKKKRYAGHITWKEGKDVDTIDIVGFEYQRSDIAPITKEVQHRVIEMIVKEGDVEGAKEYVNGVIEDVLDGNVSDEEIAIPGGIGKRLDNYDTDTAQVRGAKYANLLLDTNFQRGSKPKRLYLDRVDPAFFRRMEDECGFDPQRDPLYGAFKRDPDVICFEYDDQIPEAFEVDYDKMLEKTLKGPIERILEALDVSWEEVKSGQEQTGLDSFM
ncbi:DNA-directed DNA polymerase [Natronobacterium gregoryi]|uniref:DNA polymerase n=2 Tax=Natronobacterium gregoryi TaxID=44930 RepID=L0AD40_NATGS|nr:DNA polymerase elongation subunit [Natronobacterium gregoryi]AFZ71818.1 DNA polymerase elongation subunit (family B) [Natronobacterium gregoryi SP2]ELY72951.1 DNA-directed DNA polymerase [Natronobacterium gregoryi SP2]PLK21002.1 DNA polymerase elongation subunit [Natronobacterium gregoryi SP2]SFI87132.1 DNA polymerase I [Natronobacterium gregoryi]